MTATPRELTDGSGKWIVAFAVDATSLPSGHYDYDVVFTGTVHGESEDDDYIVTRTVRGGTEVVNRTADAGKEIASATAGRCRGSTR